MHTIKVLPALFLVLGLLVTARCDADASGRAPAAPRVVTPARLGPSAGGNDLYFKWSRAAQVDVASNGDIYVAYTRNDPDVLPQPIVIERSTDGGESFQEIQVLTPALGDQGLFELAVVEGSVDRVIVLYLDGFPGELRVSYADLSSVTGPWFSSSIAASSPSVAVRYGALTEDSIDYSTWYLYAVWEGDDSDGTDIMFSRSTDFGTTWDPPYRIGDQTQGYNYQYRYPAIDYAQGSLHVGWTYTERLQDEFDDAIHYRRCLDFGDSGISGWDPLTVVFPDDDGVEQRLGRIAASDADGSVLMLYRPEYFDVMEYLVPSADGGSTWSTGSAISTGLLADGALVYRPSDDRFIVSGAGFSRFNPGYWTEQAFRTVSPPSPSLSLGPVQVLADTDQVTYSRNPGDIALDPTHGEQVAMVWDYNLSNLFDAQWRAPLPHPAPEPGFPLSIPETPYSSPALVDLDGDGDQEILFTTIEGSVYVVEHDGSVRPGWPQSIGAANHRAPVAVGDLNGDGRLEILAASATGTVYSFAPDGSLNPYWPVDLGTGAPAYLCIGALGPVYDRHAVVASGDRLFALSYRGEDRGYGWILTGPVDQPPSVGDLDDDGVAEIVVVQGPWILRGALGSASIDVIRNLAGKTASGPAALADLDQNGDLEIVVPTDEGDVYAVHHNGSDVAGWPFSNPAGGRVYPVAVAQNLGTTQPDVSFVQLSGEAHLLTHSGIEQANFPVPMGVAVQGIIVERVNRASSNLVGVGPYGMAWSIQNNGVMPPAWPMPLGIAGHLAPAAGDIDFDGLVELVFLTERELRVFEVAESPDSAGRHWPMYGYDAQRTSCLNCTEDVVTAVGPSTGSQGNRLSTPWPNPALSRVRMSYALASDSEVSLSVYDLRGRRVREILHGRRDAGAHSAAFDGRDEAGNRLAGGVYLLRLRVNGEGREQTLTRKFTWVR